MKIEGMYFRIIGSIVLAVVIIIAGILIYGQFQNQKQQPIPEISNATLTGVSETASNASYVFNFSSPYSIEPQWIRLLVYSSILTYNGFSSSSFQFIDLSGLPNTAFIQNWNGSSSGIFSGATITFYSWGVFHAFTKYGTSLEVMYNNNSSLSASLLPISLSGSLTYVKTYYSTDASGQNMTVAQVYMNFNPSPLDDVTVTVKSPGVYSVLPETGLTTNPSWPSGMPEIMFANIVNNATTGPLQAFCNYVNDGGYGSAGSQIPSGELLYITAPAGEVSLNSAVVSITSALYAGSLEVTW